MKKMVTLLERIAASLEQLVALERAARSSSYLPIGSTVTMTGPNGSVKGVVR